MAVAAADTAEVVCMAVVHVPVAAAAAAVVADTTAHLGGTASNANQLNRSASAEGKWRLSETRQAQVKHQFENYFIQKKC